MGISEIFLLTYANTHTQTQALALLLTSDVHLGHYRRRDGGEIEREETKRGKEGERGLVFTKVTHSIYLFTPPLSFCLVSIQQINHIWALLVSSQLTDKGNVYF